MAANGGRPEGPQLPGLQYHQWLGSGGFSDVFLYERDRPRIKVAIKVLKADSLDEVQLRQFMAEAEAMAELAEHPFIVPVLGSGTTPDGRPYLEMRFYPQASLADRVAQQPLSVPEALKIGIQLSSAIETAHRANIIHRDIKPANVLMSSYGVPGLTDFGIAGRPGEIAEDDDNVGVSIPWSPPEVLSGQSNGSRASDVYSLAATVWHLLVGRSPFAMPGGDNTERAMFARILHSKPPSVGRADAPSSIDRLLQMAMSKDPTHRPQTAIEFARQLQRVEQELRLARTEIVVLDAHVPAPVAPTTDSFAPPQPASNATVLKAPTSVSPTAAPSRTAPAEAPKTALRPASSKPAPSSASPRRRGDASTDATTRSPQKVEASATHRRPAALEAEPEAVEEARPRPLGAIIAVVVLLVAIVGVGVFVLTSGGDSDKKTELPKTGPTSLTDIGGVTERVPQPLPTASTSDGMAVFTWTQANPTDVYTVQIVGGGTETVTTPTFSQAFGASSEICIMVVANRTGASPSALSPKVCAKP